MNDEIVEIALCEYSKIILKEDQLYKFIAVPDCEECKRLQEVYK